MKIPLRYGATMEPIGRDPDGQALFELHIPWYARPFFIAEALWGRLKGWLS